MSTTEYTPPNNLNAQQKTIGETFFKVLGQFNTGTQLSLRDRLMTQPYSQKQKTLDIELDSPTESAIAYEDSIYFHLNNTSAVNFTNEKAKITHRIQNKEQRFFTGLAMDMLFLRNLFQQRAAHNISDADQALYNSVTTRFEVLANQWNTYHNAPKANNQTQLSNLFNALEEFSSHARKSRFSGEELKQIDSIICKVVDAAIATSLMGTGVYLMAMYSTSVTLTLVSAVLIMGAIAWIRGLTRDNENSMTKALKPVQIIEDTPTIDNQTLKIEDIFRSILPKQESKTWSEMGRKLCYSAKGDKESKEDVLIMDELPEAELISDNELTF